MLLIYLLSVSPGENGFRHLQRKQTDLLGLSRDETLKTFLQRRGRSQLSSAHVGFVAGTALSGRLTRGKHIDWFVLCDLGASVRKQTREEHSLDMSGFCRSVDGEWTVMEKYGGAEGPAVNVMSTDCLLTLPCALCVWRKGCYFCVWGGHISHEGLLTCFVERL